MDETTASPAPDPVTTEPVAEAPAPRFEWGPDVPDAYQPPPLPGVKDDAHVVFVKHDPETGETHFEVSPHDPGLEVAPERMHLVLYAPGAAIHAHAADAVSAAAAGDHPTSSADVAVADPAQASPVVLPRPSSAKANVKYTAKSVLEFPA